jgi:hypothetical protein
MIGGCYVLLLLALLWLMLLTLELLAVLLEEFDDELLLEELDWLERLELELLCVETSVELLLLALDALDVLDSLSSSQLSTCTAPLWNLLLGPPVCVSNLMVVGQPSTPPQRSVSVAS